jgi:hypothetical protein
MAPVIKAFDGGNAYRVLARRDAAPSERDEHPSECDERGTSEEPERNLRGTSEEPRAMMQP